MIEDLIRAYINAKAEHDRLFALNDQGLESEQAVLDALGPISDALIALCRARSIDPFERDRRRQYLSATLYDAIEGCEGLIRAVLEALLEEREAT